MYLIILYMHRHRSRIDASVGAPRRAEARVERRTLLQNHVAQRGGVHLVERAHGLGCRERAQRKAQVVATRIRFHDARRSDGEADVGIVLGGSGQGEQLASNKVRGVRAALCNCLYTARMARQHNDANVLSIGARVVGVGLAEEIVDTFLSTEFEGGRHARRVDQLTALEEEF